MQIHFWRAQNWASLFIERNQRMLLLSIVLCALFIVFHRVHMFPLAVPKKIKCGNCAVEIRISGQISLTFRYLKLLWSFVISRPDTMARESECEIERERETKSRRNFFFLVFFFSIKKVNLGTYWESQIWRRSLNK